MPRVHHHLALSIAGLILIATSARAQVAIEFDHDKCSADAPDSGLCNPTYQRSLEPGGLLIVRVKNTDAAKFSYSIAGVEKPKDTTTPSPQLAREPRDIVPVTQVHSPQYGGYVVKISRVQGADSKLGDATVTIAVRTLEWDVGFGSGFSVSGLINPPYVVRDSVIPAANGQSARTVSIFTEDAERKDEAALGAGAFVHIGHTKVPWVAATFGLGLQTTSGAAYYLGPSVRFGDKASLTLGAVFGRVRTPPSGIQLGDPVASANVMNDLGSRTTIKPFLALSYAFIGGARDALIKPVLGADSPARGGGTPTATAAPAPANAAVRAMVVVNDSQHVTQGVVLEHALEFRLEGEASRGAHKAVQWWSSPGSLLLEDVDQTTNAEGRAQARKVTVREPGTHIVRAVVFGVGPRVGTNNQLEVSFTGYGCKASEPECPSRRTDPTDSGLAPSSSTRSVPHRHRSTP